MVNDILPDEADLMTTWCKKINFVEEDLYLIIPLMKLLIIILIILQIAIMKVTFFDSESKR